MFTPEQFPSEEKQQSKSNPTEGEGAPSHHTSSVPGSSKHGSATQNDGVKSVKEDPQALATYDPLHYHVFKLRSKFGRWNSHHQILKNISASPQILRTYHDTFLFGKVPLSARARTVLRTGPLGTVWNMLEFTLALLSGVLYVISTYRPISRGSWAYRVQDAISIAFLADYLLRIYCEPVRLYFIFSFWGIVDFLSFIPIILVFRNHIEGQNFLRLLQFVRVIRTYHLTNKVGTFGSSVTQQITVLTIATCGVIFLIAGILQWVEFHLASPEKRASESCTVQGCITFWESIYFLVVTVSTVGYGDITPSTMIGQLIAIVTIVGALTILPIQIGRITSLAYRRPYGGSFNPNKIIGSRFLIISGSITLSTVQNFLSEFYNPTHSEGLEIYPLRVIILAPFSPTFELKQVIQLYKGLVEFIEGSPVRQLDLERVSAGKAAAFFLLADNEAENPPVEDAAQVIRALAVYRFCLRANQYKRRVRIIVEVLDPETENCAVWDNTLTGGIEVICPVKVHYKMMARSCVVRGLYTLITNLFTSELRLQYLNQRHFLAEYFHSFDNEVYPVILPEAFHGLGFEEAVDFIYTHFQSILFAVDTSEGFKSAGKRLEREVLLYPKGHVIDPDDVGLIISADLHTAYAISTYRSTGDSRLNELRAKATKTAKTGRHNEGTELVDPASGRWRRSSSSATKSLDRAPQSTGPQSAATFGVKGPTSYTTDPENNRELEYELRSAIQTVYTAQQYPDWVQQQPSLGEISSKRENKDSHAQELESGRVEEGHGKSHGTGGVETVDPSHRFPEGMSLEKAARDLLAWPPLSCTDRPHPAVIEDKEDVIMKDLEEKTITMLAFDVPHILVCCQSGWPKHFFYFLLELRREGMPSPPVVMLHPGKISAKEWGSVGIFKDVYFMKGSPLYELDLLRGGVLQAEKIVILSDHGVPVDLQGESSQNYAKRTPTAYTSDVENIVAAANVQRLHGHSVNDNVIVEMQHTEAFYYLRPQFEIPRAHYSNEGFKRSRDGLVHFVPPFMEGKAICASMAGFLMRASFYNRNTQTLVDQLIQGGYKKGDDGGGHTEQQHRTLDQVRVPEQYVNKPFSELFLGLRREQGVLAIGLYRIRGHLGAPTSYVLTNPYPDWIVTADDLVYVIH